MLGKAVVPKFDEAPGFFVTLDWVLIINERSYV